MLDVRYLCDNIDEVEAILKKRGKDFDLSKIKELAAQRKQLTQVYEENQQKLNQNKHLMAKLDKKSEEFAQKRDEMKTISSTSKEAKVKLSEVMEQLDELVMYLPNLPEANVPLGKGEDDNIVLRYWGEKPVLDFEPKNHWDLDPKQNLMDFERGVKVAGSRFTVLKNAAASMERALISFMVDTHLDNGYNEVFVIWII